MTTHSLKVHVAHYDDRGDPYPPNNYRAEIVVDEAIRFTADIDGYGCTTEANAEGLKRRILLALQAWCKANTSTTSPLPSRTERLPWEIRVPKSAVVDITAEPSCRVYVEEGRHWMQEADGATVPLIIVRAERVRIVEDAATDLATFSPRAEQIKLLRWLAGKIRADFSLYQIAMSDTPESDAAILDTIVALLDAPEMNEPPVPIEGPEARPSTATEKQRKVRRRGK